MRLQFECNFDAHCADFHKIIKFQLNLSTHKVEQIQGNKKSLATLVFQLLKDQTHDVDRTDSSLIVHPRPPIGFS